MKNKSKEDSNFWMIYANLIAGLFFVFILLIGAIVAKYVLTQSDLRQVKNNLDKQETYLKESKQELKDKEAIIFSLSSDLNLDFVNSQKVDLKLNSISYKQFNEDLNLSLDIKNKQILILLEQLKKKDEQINNLKEDFKKAKIKVQNLGLIRENLSKQLKSKLNAIDIDEKTTSISFPTQTLFDKDSYVLKNEAKANLRKNLSEYFDAILKDQEILANIENIIIQAHTHSDGSYAYNLDLSQKRVYEMMNFIYTFYKNEKLQELLAVSGCSFLDSMCKVKDKNSSIEIKLSIKNDNALKDVQKFFELH